MSSPQKAFFDIFHLVFDSEMRDFAQGQEKIRFCTGGIHEVCRGLKSDFDAEIGGNSHFWTKTKCRCSRKPDTVSVQRSADRS